MSRYLHQPQCAGTRSIDLTSPQCNEVHPRCRNCQKMDIRCSFSAPASVPASMPLNPESLMDLELLQYCNRRRGPGHDSVDLGFTHHFLLNSILALAALQLHREAPSRHKWYARAVSHQQAALTRAKPHLQKLDASQRHALVCFSALTSVYSVAEPMARPGRLAYDKAEFNAVREIVHSTRLARASTTFVQQHLAQDISSSAYLRYKYGQRLRRLPDGLDEKYPQLAPLRALVDKYCPVDKRAICLDAAVRALAGIALNQSEGGGERPGATWDWANGVDDAFLELCVKENPAALVILAHYATLMSTENDEWFLRTWPTVLVKYISRRLGDGWKEMEWPMSLVLGTSELGSEGSASISVSTSSPERSPSHQSPGPDAKPEVEV
jgi:hypothetical protein